MPHLSLPIDSERGPIIKLVIGVSEARRHALQQTNQPVPDLIQIEVLVDTGASWTALDEWAIAALALAPTESIVVYTPANQGEGSVRLIYEVGMLLYHPDHSRHFASHSVIATDFSSQNIGGVLGRDVLRHCLLTYDGVQNTFALAF